VVDDLVIFDDFGTHRPGRLGLLQMHTLQIDADATSIPPPQFNISGSGLAGFTPLYLESVNGNVFDASKYHPQAMSLI
jgi:hypothetical protein